jgi:eukaryotic-like serine/threonine-protein kinase
MLAAYTGPRSECRAAAFRLGLRCYHAGMTEAEASSSPIRRIGRYALYGEIASGGMATVYLGRQWGQAGFARTVAIKRLHPQHAKEPDFVAMFLDEARLAARIRHPNVVPTLDVVATDGELFLVMEYVQGESFSRLLRVARQRKESVPTRVVAAIVTDVLHGLHAAHEATSEKGEPLGLVHRDISPHNVLVGCDGAARVVDFGVAKAAGRIQTTREGQLKGKIAYMAPEQITGVASRRTDVYAASVVLWEALTARRLFSGENDASVMNQVINSKAEPPSKHVAGLDPAWDEIVLKGLERDEERRYSTAREMALEIEQRMQLARGTEVGAWVDALAHESIAKRAAEVTAIESASDVETVPASAEPSAMERTSSSSPVVAPARPDPAAAAPPGPHGAEANVVHARATVPDVPKTGESTASRLSVSRPLITEGPRPARRSRVALMSTGVVVSAAIIVTWAVVAVRSSPAAPGTPTSAASESTPAAVADSMTSPVPSSSVPSAALVASAPAPTLPAASGPTATSHVGPTWTARPAAPLRPKNASAPSNPTSATLGSVLDTRH